MRVYILADLEGMSGITWPDERRRRGIVGPGHERLSTLMVGEINAAVSGAIDAGADEIVVRDSHGWSDTVRLEDLHPRARLSQGAPAGDPMPHLDATFDAIVMVGQHARAGNATGCLSHTYSRRIGQVRVNGVPVGEIAIYAALAGEIGVPVAFVSGDTEAVAEARQLLQAVETVVTKVSHSRLCALSHPLGEAHRAIRSGVRASLERRERHKPFTFACPTEVAVAYRHWYVAVARLLVRRHLTVCDLSKLPALVYRAPTLRDAWRAFLTSGTARPMRESWPV